MKGPFYQQTKCSWTQEETTTAELTGVALSPSKLFVNHKYDQTAQVIKLFTSWHKSDHWPFSDFSFQVFYCRKPWAKWVSLLWLCNLWMGLWWWVMGSWRSAVGAHSTRIWSYNENTNISSNQTCWCQRKVSLLLWAPVSFKGHFSPDSCPRGPEEPEDPHQQQGTVSVLLNTCLTYKLHLMEMCSV